MFSHLQEGDSDFFSNPCALSQPQQHQQAQEKQFNQPQGYNYSLNHLIEDDGSHQGLFATDVVMLVIASMIVR